MSRDTTKTIVPSAYPQIDGLPNLLEICLERLKDSILITGPLLSNGQSPVIVWANKAFYVQNGFEGNDVLGKTLEIIQGPETDREKLDQIRTALEQSEEIRIELINYRKDRSTYINEVEILPILTATGKVSNFLSIQRDISERRRLEIEILDEKEYAENIVESVREPMLVLSSSLRILTANTSFYEIFKTTHEETIGQFIYDLGDQQWDIPELRVLFEKILPLSSVFNGYEVEHNFPGIGRKTMLLNAREIYRKSIGSNIILLAMEDITARKVQQELEHKLAYYDPLTKLATRALLKDRLAQSMQLAKRHQTHGLLMFIDIDNFKPINDMYGHDAGDAVLIEIALRLKSAVRLVDTVSRFGGDEFVVLLNELSGDKPQALEHATSIAEKIRMLLAAPYQIEIVIDNAEPSEADDQTHPVTHTRTRLVTHLCSASIGAVLFMGTTFSSDTLIKRADLAMYRAKERGRDQVEFYEEQLLED